MVHIIGTEPEMFNLVSRATLQKVLDSERCFNVQDPISKDWVGFDCLELQDDMTILARSRSISFDSRVGHCDGVCQQQMHGVVVRLWGV
jgi:hypothetical protein